MEYVTVSSAVPVFTRFCTIELPDPARYPETLAVPVAVQVKVDPFTSDDNRIFVFVPEQIMVSGCIVITCGFGLTKT